MRKVYTSGQTPDLTSHFKHATELEHDNCVKHQVLGDKSLFEGCGYATHDEASLIYQLAMLNKGLWLEIGAHTGWTTAHMALPGNRVISVEPEFKRAMYNRTNDANAFFSRYIENVGSVIGIENIVISSAQMIEDDLTHPLRSFVYPLGELSWDCLPKLAERLNKRVTGAFIDGEHVPPFPIVDAMLVAPFLGENSLVVFHDAIGSPVVAGVHWLVNWMQQNGRSNVQVRRYMTPQFLTVVTCGTVQVPEHQPDATFDWTRYAQQIDREVEASLNKDFERWRTYATGWTRRPLDTW